jgi:hypothetical protein
MTYKKLERRRCAGSRWRLGFVVTAGERRPILVFSVTYKTKAEAEEAHCLMIKLIEGPKLPRVYKPTPNDAPLPSTRLPRPRGRCDRPSPAWRQRTPSTRHPFRVVPYLLAGAEFRLVDANGHRLFVRVRSDVRRGFLCDPRFIVRRFLLEA